MSSASEKHKASSFGGSEERGYDVTAANEDATHDAVFGDLDGNGPNFRAPLVAIVVTIVETLRTYGTCTAVFMIVVFVVSFGCATIRTLGNITWLGWVGLMSILSAVLVMTISVGVQDRPADAPRTGPWDKDFKVVTSPSFADAISAVATILFAAAGTPTYFGIISEMRDPRLYRRAMIINQVFVTVMYVVIGSIVYYYAGQYVAQPALGTAGPLMKKICYGLAIPGLFFSVILWVHIPAKFIMVRILRGSEHLTKSSMTHWVTWISCSFACTTIAYIIASAIPMLGSIIALVGALIAPMLCIIPFGFMWFHDNIKGKDKRTMSLKLKLGSIWASFVILVGIFITVAGTYGAVVSIINQPGGGKPWSCEDNSNSV